MTSTSPGEQSPTVTGVFDQHLAAHYDRTRALSQDAMSEVVRVLARELAGRGRCLEIGIGTGRIALPLVEAGVPMVGIDPSVPMLARLREKAPEGAGLGLLRADATALPFASAAFGAGLMCHVLHLIRRWEDALRELVRVVRRPGVILSELAVGGGRSTGAEVRTFFHEAAGMPPYGRLGVRDAGAVDDALRALGARPRDLATIADQHATTVASVIDNLELGINSSNAAMPEDVRRRAAEATREWAAARYGTLATPVHRERAITWRAYDLP